MQVTNGEISVALREPEPPEEAPEAGLLNMAGILSRARLLWRRRGFLVRFVAVSVAVGAILAFALPRNYESTAQVMLPENKSSLATTLTSAGGSVSPDLLALAGLNNKTPAALFVGVLRSRTVQDRLIAKYDLRKVYGVSLQETARNRLKENTAISDDPKSGIISIVVGDRDKIRARDLAQSYVEELNRLLAEANTSAAHRERVFLEERLKLAHQEMSQAARDFSEFASKNATLDLKDQGRAMVNATAELEGRLIAARAELMGLEQIYTPENVRVRSVRARIGELEQQLNKFKGKVSPGTTESGDTESPFPSLRALPLLGVKYSELYLRSKIQEQVLEALSRQYELARVQEAKELPTVAVLDAPVLAERKAGMRRIFLILLTFVLAVIAGCTWVLGEESWSALDPQNPRKLLVKEAREALASELLVFRQRLHLSRH
jgi:capsule polysaccharide export protein KpsE/RkpR